MALEYYDWFFRRYPAELAEHTARCRPLRRQRSERPRRAALSEKVAETTVAIARRLADKPVALRRVTMLVAAVVAFGALFVSGWLQPGRAHEARLGDAGGDGHALSTRGRGGLGGTSRVDDVRALGACGSARRQVGWLTASLISRPDRGTV
jgi:hypothetical protein